MANRSEKLVAFHGGLNDNSDAKDIAEDELSSAIDCSVSRVGRVGVIGGQGTVLTNIDGASINPVKDYGLFYFSSDRDKDGNQLSEDWLALYDSGDGKIQFYYRDKQGSTPDISSTIEDAFIDAGKASTGKPSFFIADGILRYSNGDFDAATNNRVHQYVDKGFFDKTTASETRATTGNWSNANNIVSNLANTTGINVGDIVTGDDIPPNTKVLELVSNQARISNVPINTVAKEGEDVVFSNKATVVRQGWVHSDQQLKSFDDIFGINGFGSLKIDKSDTAGPDTTAISTELGTIVLSYWSSDDGKWNGSFQFAASPIYHQGGIGPISEFGTTVNFYEKKVSFQLHIGLTGTISGTTHPFGDDRITGIRIFFRSHGADKWHKLKDFDMLKGGKFNWAEYESGTHTSYGIFNGSIGTISLATTSNFTLTGCSFNDNSTTINHPADNRIAVGYIISGDDGLPTDAQITAIIDSTSSTIHTATVDSSGGQVSLTFTPTGGASVESYKETTASFSITNSASGFTGRYGFLRMWGPYNEPIWKNVNDNGTPISLASASHTMTVTSPGEGVREFQVELLDETFQVVAQSSKQKITVSDSGNAPPPTYQDDADSS